MQSCGNAVSPVQNLPIGHSIPSAVCEALGQYDPGFALQGAGCWVPPAANVPGGLSIPVADSFQPAGQKKPGAHVHSCCRSAPPAHQCPALHNKPMSLSLPRPHE